MIHYIALQFATISFLLASNLSRSLTIRFTWPDDLFKRLPPSVRIDAAAAVY